MAQPCGVPVSWRSYPDNNPPLCLFRDVLYQQLHFTPIAHQLHFLTAVSIPSSLPLHPPPAYRPFWNITLQTSGVHLLQPAALSSPLRTPILYNTHALPDGLKSFYQVGIPTCNIPPCFYRETQLPTCTFLAQLCDSERWERNDCERGSQRSHGRRDGEKRQSLCTR